MKTDGWETQAWALNLSDYRSLKEVYREIDRLDLSSKTKIKAKRLARSWWRKNR
jgi:hypothetical protein